MLSKYFKKIPAATIIVPLFVGALINSLAPSVFDLGPMTKAIASPDGLNAIIDITLLAVGSQLTLARLKKALHRGLVLLLSKWLTSIALGYIFF